LRSFGAPENKSTGWYYKHFGSYGARQPIHLVNGHLIGASYSMMARAKPSLHIGDEN